MFTKELRRSDFLITIEEYVGAKGNTLVDHKKIKKIYKRDRKDIKSVKKGRYHKLKLYSHI